MYIETKDIWQFPNDEKFRSESTKCCSLRIFPSKPESKYSKALSSIWKKYKTYYTFSLFQAFKFPDVMDLLIECNVELCKSQCQSCNQQQVSQKNSSNLF